MVLGGGGGLVFYLQGSFLFLALIGIFLTRGCHVIAYTVHGKHNFLKQLQVMEENLFLKCRF